LSAVNGMTKSYRQKLAEATARAERAEADCLDAKIRLVLFRQQAAKLQAERDRRLTRNVWLTANHVAPHDEVGKLDLAAQLVVDPSLIPLALRHAPHRASAALQFARPVVVRWPGIKDWLPR